MYSIDLEKITLDDFQEMLTSVDLLPGRRILLDGLSEIIQRLQQKEVHHLDALRKLLLNKKSYPELAAALLVSIDYLTVLNREANSYVSKPVPLSALNMLSELELEKLTSAGIKTTKDIYEQAKTPTMRQEIVVRLAIPPEKIILALQLSDLLRINGVGPAFAAILLQIGIRSVTDYQRFPSDEILARCQRAGVKLGIKDVEYCKRFCRKLDTDIEW